MAKGERTDAKLWALMYASSCSSDVVRRATWSDTSGRLVRMLFESEANGGRRRRVTDWLYMSDLDTFGVAEPGEQISDDRIYRVLFDDNSVQIICFGTDVLDPKVEGMYDSPDALPKWVKERIAVLMLMPHSPPNKEVEGVGQRISENIYWVYS